MTYKLICFPDKQILVSDEEIRTGELLTTIFNNKFQYIDECTEIDKQEDIINYYGKLIKWTSGKDCFKIVAGIKNLPSLNLSLVEEELEIVDVWKLAIEYQENISLNAFADATAFKDGFNKSQELNKNKHSLQKVTEAISQVLEAWQTAAINTKGKANVEFLAEIEMTLLKQKEQPKVYSVEVIQENNIFKVIKIIK